MCPNRALACATLLLALAACASPAPEPRPDAPPFTRVAVFPVHRNVDGEAPSAAEIVAATPDGRTLVYADSLRGGVGFVDIADPAAPRAGGLLALGGRPTSVATHGPFALVVVDTSEDPAAPSGRLDVVDVAARRVAHSRELGGQPDSIAVEGGFAAIALENERGEGRRPPQAPPGELALVALDGAPADWRLRRVALTGLPIAFPDDPEPEYVDLRGGVAALTLQENNGLALVDVQRGELLRAFDAGRVALDGVDVVADGRVDVSGATAPLPREPDAVAWLSDSTFATANEGDLDGGTRGFTLWSDEGEVLYDSGAALERELVRMGRLPEHRAGHRGLEPEGVESAVFDGTRLLFVSSERADVVFVYELPAPAPEGERAPRLVQVLATGVGPEGLLALPARDLFVVASEVDEPEAGRRSEIWIYARERLEEPR